MKARMQVVALFGILTVGPFALANPPGVPDGAKQIAMSDCSCSPPTDIDPDCTTTNMNCYRYDGPAVVTAQGTPKVVQVMGRCQNCADCPCEDGATLTCEAVAEFQRTASATATISSSVGVDAVFIEAKISAALGLTVGTIQVVTCGCSLQVPPCWEASAKATLIVTEGKTAEVEHEWFLTGTWAGGSACPISGNPFVKSCGVDYSTGEATLVGDCSCVMLSNEPCL